MIVTDTKPAKRNMIKCNNKSIIQPPPYVGGHTLLLFPISSTALYKLFIYKSIYTKTFFTIFGCLLDFFLFL